MEKVPKGGGTYWLKVVEMLQQNWALVEEWRGAARIWFIDDASGVFDSLDFNSLAEADMALARNGFERHDASLRHSPLRAPKPPYMAVVHPEGSIYSSGRYWR